MLPRPPGWGEFLPAPKAALEQAPQPKGVVQRIDNEFSSRSPCEFGCQLHEQISLVKAENHNNGDNLITSQKCATTSLSDFLGLRDRYSPISSDINAYFWIQFTDKKSHPTHKYVKVARSIVP
jgi:hypothetical protein